MGMARARHPAVEVYDLVPQRDHHLPMHAPWTMQIASDVIRDGLGLELVDSSGDIAAEVFRCDADHSVTVRRFDDSVPDDVLAELVDHARRCLSPFEDGTPLPDTFTLEPPG